MISGQVLLYHALDETDATFNSDPPYELGWAKEGSVIARCDNWGNVDNTLDIDVYWGIPRKGFLPTVDNLTFVQDTGLNVQIVGTGGVSTEVAGFLAIPQLKSRFMRLGFTLAGTSQEVDATVWFDGHS